MLQNEQKEYIDKLLEKSVREISISETQYNLLRESYKKVGKYLEESDILKNLHPEIHPQGSIRLGTAVKPVDEESDIDIDLVCEFTRIPSAWTQENLKDIVGACLKLSPLYGKMIEKPDGGKRCWKLQFRKNSNDHYHMDILPAIVADDYRNLLESFDYKDYSKLAICITDRDHWGYTTSTNHADWPHSNPFGYAKWFESRCQTQSMILANESVEEVPKYDSSKSVLKDVIKLLKRHRDIMYGGDDEKPISIIITTLAAKSYRGERNIFDALQGIVQRMSSYIEEGRDETGKMIKKVMNPSDIRENFADKWSKEPRKEEKFYKWLVAVQNAVEKIAVGDAMSVRNGLESILGKKVSVRTYEAIGGEMALMRLLGKVSVSTAGTLGTAGAIIQPHNFHGK